MGDWDEDYSMEEGEEELPPLNELEEALPLPDDDPQFLPFAEGVWEPHLGAAVWPTVEPPLYSRPCTLKTRAELKAEGLLEIPEKGHPPVGLDSHNHTPRPLEVSENPLSILPTGALLRLLIHCDPYTSMLVCRDWYNLVSSNGFWRAYLKFSVPAIRVSRYVNQTGKNKKLSDADLDKNWKTLDCKLYYKLRTFFAWTTVL